MTSEVRYKPSGSDWLGNLPSHWQVMRLKHLGFFKGGAGFPIDSQGQTQHELPFFKVKDITGASADGYMSETDSSVSPEIAQALGARVFPVDTIAFAKVGAALLLNRFRLIGRPACMDNNMMGYIIERDGVSARFVWWMMHRIDFSDVVNPGTVPSLNEPLISNIFAAIPPLDEQLAIATYLDAETKRIDGLIEEKVKLVQLLAELKRSTIEAHLDCTGDVWKVSHAFSMGSGTTPPSGDAQWYGGDTPWVQTSELRERVIRETEKTVTDSALDAFSALKVYPPGTLMVAMYGATIGRLGILGVPAACNQACCALIPEGPVTAEFLFWWLYANKQELLLRASGGTQPNVSSNVIANLRFLAPSLQEQERRVAVIAKETQRIDLLVEHVAKEMEVLREFRSATITDAVLGRIDVREHMKN